MKVIEEKDTIYSLIDNSFESKIEMKSFSKWRIDEIRKNPNLYLDRAVSDRKKIFIKLLCNDNFMAPYLKEDYYQIEVGSAEYDINDFIAIMENNVLDKTVFSLAIIERTLLKNLPKFNEEMSELVNSVDSKENFLTKSVELTNKYTSQINGKILEKNSLKLYIYGIYVDNSSEFNFSIKSKLKYLDFGSCVKDFLTKHPTTGVYVTDTTLYKDGVIDKDTYINKWNKKSDYYYKWLHLNFTDDKNNYHQPDFIVIKSIFEFGGALKNLIDLDSLNSSGEKKVDLFQNNASMLFIFGKDSIESSTLSRLNELFGY